MTSVEKISQFVQGRIEQLKAEQEGEEDLRDRLNTSAKRISFANVLPY